MERGIAPICNPSTIYRQCVTLSKHIAVSQHCRKMNLTSTEIRGPVDYLSASLTQIYSHHIKRVSKSRALLKRAPRVHMHHISSAKGVEVRGENADVWMTNRLVSWEKSAAAELFMVCSCQTHFSLLPFAEKHLWKASDKWKMDLNTDCKSRSALGEVFTSFAPAHLQ